jgi:hypothetical protein
MNKKKIILSKINFFELRFKMLSRKRDALAGI